MALAVIAETCGLMPSEVRDFVDALDRDQGRVHVHRDEPYALQLLLARNQAAVETRAGAKGRDRR